MMKLNEFLDVKENEYFGANIFIRFDAPVNSDWYGFQLDVQCMPVYCKKCHNTLKDLYCHCGSRYGQVGTLYCDRCENEIYVTDHDNIVNRINYNGDEFLFNELYKTHWKYLKQLEQKENINLIKIFPQNKQSFPINDVLSRLKERLGKEITGKYQYVTDKRLDKLPYEINKWIELLDICGVEGVYLLKHTK